MATLCLPTLFLNHEKNATLIKKLVYVYVQKKKKKYTKIQSYLVQIRLEKRQN